MTLRVVRGSGVVRDGDLTPFHGGLLRPAVPTEVHGWLERIRPARAELEVGELRIAPGAPFRLDAGGFDRHTFLCGQSGSGKTYSLGVMLEQLLLETSLRIVVLDPNSDNPVLMRMNSLSDLPYADELFSFVPSPLVSAATDFALGEALLAGKIASHPAFVRFGARITEEGGSDVPADWAAKRS